MTILPVLAYNINSGLRETAGLQNFSFGEYQWHCVLDILFTPLPIGWFKKSLPGIIENRKSTLLKVKKVHTYTMKRLETGYKHHIKDNVT